MTPFEHITCSRCNGSGHHSYNPTNGTTCFKCKGSGVVFTKRGAAASKFYRDSLCVPARDLKQGDSVRIETLQAVGYATTVKRWFKIISLVIQPNGPIGIQAESGDGEGTNFICTSNTLVRIKRSAEEKQELIRKAIEYQATLTKQGTPRVNKAKADNV